MHKVLVNGLLLNDQFTGVQYYTEKLAEAIFSCANDNSYVQLLLSKNYKGSIENKDSKNIHKLSFSTENRIRRISFENFQLIKYFNIHNFDLYHATSYVLPFNWRKPSIVTVHDLIAIEYPSLCRPESALYFNFFLPRSIKSANHIIVLTEEVKSSIIQSYNIHENNITVIYPGIDKKFKKKYSENEKILIKEKYNLPNKYILFVGCIERKKNLVRLIESYAKLRNDTSISHKLILVGKNGWGHERVFSEIEKRNLTKEVKHLGYINDHDLPLIYSLADLFVFPSLYEGFGFPPLEAMACEVPVLVSNKGALPEITGGKCLQVDPYNIREIAEGMFILLTAKELREKSIQQGKNWVKQFTWENTAQKTLMLYNKVIESNETING
jgi:glycosyltransferase involved in cell wall biosynthesis